MNLQEFLAFKQDCPFCNKTLSFCFHSQKQQTIRYEENRLIVLFRLDGLKKHQIDYKVGYSFGLLDNSWRVEFYTQDEKRFENDSPKFLRDRFIELDSNLRSTYRFYKHCKICCRYNYSSNLFMFDMKEPNIGALSISSEYYGLSQPLVNCHRIIKVNINHLHKNTSLLISKEESDVWARSDSTFSMARHITLPKVMNTDSIDAMMDKLKTILVFS